MGWLYMKSLGGHAGPQAYLDDQFSYDAPSASYQVLQSALIGNRAYYAAVERTKSATNSRDVFAVVCLVDYNPSDPEGYGAKAAARIANTPRDRGHAIG